MYRFGVIVSYDCKSSKLREKAIEACFDCGLDRIQYSVFSGVLKSTPYKELVNRLKLLLEHKEPISIFIQKVPVGSIRDFLLYEYDERAIHHFKVYVRGKRFFD